VTSKWHLLGQNCKIVRSVHPFLDSSPFYPTPKFYTLQSFPIGQKLSKVAKSARSCRGSTPHLIRGSLDPPDSVSQTASRLVQPFCTAHGRESLYLPLWSQNCTFAWGSGHASLGPPEYSEQHLDRFSRFCRAHGRNRPTDHATPSAAIPVPNAATSVMSDG